MTATTAKQIPLSCPGHTRPVVDLAYSGITEGGFFLISACKDGKPMLRQGNTGDWLGTFDGHKGAVWGATLNKDATLAATGAADFSAKIWDATTGKEAQTFEHVHIVKSVDFSSDQQHLLTGSNEKKMRIFDLNKPETEPTVLAPLGGNPRSCLWFNDDKNILSGGDEKCLRLWDVSTQQEVNKIEFETPLLGLKLSPDKSVLAASVGSQVSFYDPLSLSLIKTYAMKCPIEAVSFSPDMQSFVAGGEDFVVYKYNYDTGTLLEAHPGHFGAVHCLEFAPDGELYASGSEDGTIRLWQMTVGKTYGLWQAVESNGDEKPSEGIKCNGVS